MPQKNSLSQSNDPRKLPVNEKPPRTASAGSFKVICLALLTIILLGGAFFWLTLKESEKDALRAQAADLVNHAASGTPLAGIGDALRQSPPPPPSRVINPPTDQGTLAGRTVTGTIASPLILGSMPIPSPPEAQSGETGAEASDSSPTLASPAGTALTDAEGKPVFTPQVLPPAREDSRVPATCLEEIAQWLATRYKTGTGVLAFNPQSMNQLLDSTIAAHGQGGRASLLRYAFQPSMLTGLYKLYIDQFMLDLSSASKKRGFTPGQDKQFHMALAGQSALAASALEAIAGTPELGSRLKNIDAMSQKVVDLNTQLASAVGELDELRRNRGASQQISAATMRVDGLSARYRRAMEEHSTARTAFANELKKQIGQPMDEDSLLFLAGWVERRLAAGESAREALNNGIALLRDLSRRCEQAAESAR